MTCDERQEGLQNIFYFNFNNFFKKNVKEDINTIWVKDY